MVVVAGVPATPFQNTLARCEGHREDVEGEEGLATRLARFFRATSKPVVFSVDSGPLYDPLERAMRRAGCHTLMFGVETPTAAVLDSHHKGTTPARVREAFGLARRLKFRTLAHFIVGLEGEDEDSLARLVDFAIELDPDIASFNAPDSF